MNPHRKTYRTILFPSDGSTQCVEAARFVIGLARHTGASVHVLHNLEEPELTSDQKVEAAADPGDFLARIHAEQQARLDQLVSLIEAEGVVAGGVITRAARAARAIREYAETEAIDLIALLTSADESFLDRFLGKTSADLISDSPCDVLFFTAEQARSGAAFGRILVPVNYQPESVASVGRALSLLTPGGEVEMFYDVPATFPFLHTARGVDSDHSIDEGEVEAVWQRELQEFWTRHGDPEVGTRMRKGDGHWFEDTLEAAQSDQCDLIVATEKPGLLRGLAEKLASHPTSCPVLLVRVAGDPQSMEPPYSALSEIEEDWARDVLAFWFGDLNDDGLARSAVSSRWWTHDPEFDAEIESRFGELQSRAAAGKIDPSTDPATQLAQVILLDQFSRNLGRDTPAMFANDERARLLASRMIASGSDRQLPTAMRAFCYLPFMHSESREDQDYCVALFKCMVYETQGPARESAANQLDFAIRHRDIVEKFDRFPHRNEVLGRASTSEEITFLEQPGSSF